MLIRIVSTTLFFACWFLPGISTAADDVAWLKEIQVPPSNKSAEPVGQFEPLLISKNGQSITTLQEWTTKREQLRSAWMTFLGPMPRRPESVSFTVLKSETIAEGQRELIQYECEPGLMVEAYLLHPDPAKYPFPRPGIVALHQTTDKSIDEIAGLTGPESLQLGPLLAGRGFEVICPRCFLWQTAPTYQAAVESFRKRHPETLGMHKMLYDAMRSVDILVGQPSVDRNRIGTIGHSLGAKEALYLAAFDERIQAAVASEGGLTFPSTNWEAPWYLGHTIKENNF
ncbi:MAG: hypothetical protein FJ267_17070, partial [Planctomycetes bacterium]|nr:hypothetical protein [Planctomycetota bacterium]